MSNSPEKEKWWMYPVLFLTGVLSLPLGLGLFLIPLEGILAVLNITLCGAGWCVGDLTWASQFLGPFLMCSILVSLVLYYFKEHSLGFALKVSFISFTAISLLFFGNLSLSNYFIQLPHPFFTFLLIPLILFIAGLIAFKERPLIQFSIKAFAVSIFALLLVLYVWFMIAAAPSYYIEVQKFDTFEEILAENSRFKDIRLAEITSEELDNYPILKNAINSYDLNKNEYGSTPCSEVEHDEWERTKDFIEQKWRETWYLFNVEDKDLMEELEQMEKYTSRPIPMKLRKAFENHGISLPEDVEISKSSENFGIRGFEVRNEVGTLNVYPYSRNYGIAIKFGDEYYMITFSHAD